MQLDLIFTAKILIFHPHRGFVGHNQTKTGFLARSDRHESKISSVRSLFSRQQ
ncbi:MAG: hypothetical protein V7K50_11985 [Nostoc sp.]|uniref:hypothetical protein n=1 Tax=Nostoc sp. TaxID=1180 RepID=UPI002FF7037C